MGNTLVAGLHIPRAEIHDPCASGLELLGNPRGQASKYHDLMILDRGHFPMAASNCLLR